MSADQKIKALGIYGSPRKGGNSDVLLDEAYHGMELPNKLKIAVSGCPIDCAEGWVRDLGFHASGKSMWVLVAGGNVGSKPRIGKEIARGLDDEMALKAAAIVVEYYQQNFKRGERVGRMLERLGTEGLSDAVEKGVR